jgi:hypothetical protein
MPFFDAPPVEYLESIKPGLQAILGLYKVILAQAKK